MRGREMRALVVLACCCAAVTGLCTAGCASRLQPVTRSALLAAARREQSKCGDGSGGRLHSGSILMSLQRLPPRTLRVLLPVLPTWEQWVAHWGQTPMERQGHIMECVGAGILWMWGGFFLSRTVLGLLASHAFAAAMILSWSLGPCITAYRRNVDLRGGRRGRVWGALFSGTVVMTREVLAPHAMSHHVHFQMLVRDSKDRELFFEVPQVPAYHAIEEGMHCEVVVVSREPDFDHLTGVTEAYVPEADVFVGHHPLLRRSAFLNLLDRRKKRRASRRAAAPDVAAAAVPAAEQTPTITGRHSLLNTTAYSSSDALPRRAANSRVRRRTRTAA